MDFYNKINLQKKNLCLFLILILAAGCRIFWFGIHPAGLNQDEASIGYETWSLLTTGADRSGMSWPVHFRAWGSGQNALYAYLSLPFVGLFGLNVFSIRLVNLICGLLSVAAVYALVKKGWGFRAGITAAALTAIAPWHIMLSRWALESNLFPAMFLFALWALTKAGEKRYFYYIAAVLLGLSLYAYGSAYLVITAVSLVMMVYYRAKNELSWKEMFLSVLLYMCVAFPIYLFVLANILNWGTLKIGFFTLPDVVSERMLSMSDGLAPWLIWKNFKAMVVFQNDGTSYNVLADWGCFYLISLPFCFYGIMTLIKKRGRFAALILSALACSFGLFLVYADANINRLNAIYFPLIICTAIGLTEMVKEKRAMIAVAGCYFFLFAGFCQQYFNDGYRERMEGDFFASFGEALVKAEEVAVGTDVAADTPAVRTDTAAGITPAGTDTAADATRAARLPIYVTGRANMPYIYALFYNQINPRVYRDTAEIRNPDERFELVDAFDGYRFYVAGIDRSAPGVYVLSNEELEGVGATDVVYGFKQFSVVVIE